MAMNSSGPISLGGATAGESINLENGNSATAQVSLNDTAVRNLAGVASGAITMPTNFWGKSNVVAISYTFSSNTANAALNLSSLAGYSAGKTNFTVTINSGVYVYSTSTGGYALNITGGTTGDTLTIVNNGYIMGQGGAGGEGVYANGSSGGPALNLGFGMASCTINNTNANAYIGGGGGGGGTSNGYWYCGGGGGAGGGKGGGWSGAGSYGGAGGGVGSSGSNGGGGGGARLGGGGGGRIFPGVGGSGSGGGGAGGGGYGYADYSETVTYTAGGGGGGYGASGGNGAYGGGGGGGGGTSGGSGSAAGGNAPGGGAGGGSGGKAVNLNGKTVTWTSGNTTRVWGAVS